MSIQHNFLQALTSASAESFVRLEVELKKQTKLPGISSLLIVLLFLCLEKVLSFFFGVKSFLFFKFIYK